MSSMTTEGLSELGRQTRSHYEGLVRTRRLYTVLSIGVLLTFLGFALWFADNSNAGRFFERLPFFFDFFIHFQPDDPFEIFRAMFDIPSPYADGSFKYDYEVGRVYVWGDFYIPEYF
jgi:phosphonate transport system permease protein